MHEILYRCPSCNHTHKISFKTVAITIDKMVCDRCGRHLYRL